MKILCSVKGHDPSPDELCNDGRCFTRCRRCGTELVKEERGWQPVPKGYRVVWKPAEPAAAPPAVASASPPPPREPVPPQPARRVSPEAAPQRHILVADDDPLVADILSHKLSNRGYRVTVAADGHDTLEAVERERPDALVLDAMMPRVDGYEVLRRLRADGKHRAIPILMLTARKEERDVVDALELGADDFVVKPFIPEEVLSRLARLLPRP